MSSSNRSRNLFRQPHLRLIALLGVIVPRKLRADWRQEWEAELGYRETLLAEWNNLNQQTKLDLLRRSLSAFWDALLLQPRRLEDEMFQDIRYGVRMLLMHRGFTFVAVLTLALGIGANTAMFSLVNAILLRPLPVREPQRLVSVFPTIQRTGEAQAFSYPNYVDVRDRNDVFTDLAAFTFAAVSLSRNGDNEIIYGYLLQSYNELTTLIARTTDNPSAALATIRAEVLKLDPTMPFAEVKTLSEHMSLSLFPLRIGASVVGSFGLLALLLAAIGIYGVMASAVSQRTREIGIRMALGAQSGDVLRMIVGQGLILMLIGLGFGLLGALALTQLMSGALYGVSATDAVTFVGVTALLFVVVLIGCWIPARRGARVDPMVAIRHE